MDEPGVRDTVDENNGVLTSAGDVCGLNHIFCCTHGFNGCYVDH